MRVGPHKRLGLQTPELAYARAGTAWHRAAPGTALIENGPEGAWDAGNLQPASQPVYLDDEIRYYYAGTDVRHSPSWEMEPQRAGLSMASLKPDRFVAMRAADEPADLSTVIFELPSADVFVNAHVVPDGEMRAELLDAEARPIPGFTINDCRPVTGDATSHRLAWSGAGQAAAPVGRPARLRVTARNASLYSIFVTEPDETPVYHRFAALWP